MSIEVKQGLPPASIKVKEIELPKTGRSPSVAKKVDRRDRDSGTLRHEDVARATKAVQAELKKNLRVAISMSVDRDTKNIVVRISDPETGDLVRQIPAKTMLEVSKRIKLVQGLLFNGEA